MKELKMWNDCYRYTYNKAIWMMSETDGVLSKLSLRNLITPEECSSRTPWILKCPKSIREDAVFEAYKNYKTAFTNLERGNITHFKMKFKSKKRTDWCIGGIDSLRYVNKRAVCIFPEFLGIVRLRERIWTPPYMTSKISFDGLWYYLHVPFQKKVKSKIASTVCSIDPGVRGFLNVYDHQNKKCLKICTGKRSVRLQKPKRKRQKYFGISSGDTEILQKELLKLDKMISSRATGKRPKTQRKKQLNKCILRQRLRIEHLQAELHWKTAYWLAGQYNNIVIPVFDSRSMSNRLTRSITTKTVRCMSVLAHGKFLERLKIKAEEMTTRVHLVNEHMTTKTCGNCLHSQNGIGSNEDWKCNHCTVHLDRDNNAARNMLLRYLRRI